MPVIFACLIYASAMIGANLSVATFGPWVSPINSFVLIGIDLSLRDRFHDVWSGRRHFWLRMGALILFSALASYLINPAAGRIAFASFAAFVLAGTADAIAYHWLRKRASTTGYLIRVNGSNVAGAAVDSLAFPTIAFGAFMPEIVALQFAAKTAGGFLWSLLLRRTVIA
jgi:hypothetical protein